MGVVVHPEARAAVARIAGRLGLDNDLWLSILDIGGRDINGTLRDLFQAEDWTVLDNTPAPGVDITADARTWQPPRQWDLVLCTEVLEHVEDWPAVLATAARATTPAGVLIVTCASTGRAPHAQTGEHVLPEGEHYGNIPPDALRDALGRLFADCHVEYAYPPGDAYAWCRYPTAPGGALSAAPSPTAARQP